MKNPINRKPKFTAMITILILTISAFMLMVNTTVQSQLAADQPYGGQLKAGDVPDFTVETAAYLSVRPSLTGLGQTILVNTWLIPAPNTDRKFLDMKITVTPPSASPTVVTIDSYPADGTSWFE